ncbi:MAG: D-sedoheptulose 7-phosphate isomerase [Candidatus Omnitrophota bacterium]|jgi:D-sedoheptulose 7-phosphate isomerase
MDMDAIFHVHRQVVDHIDQDLREPMLSGARMLVDCLNAGGKILICGNGGSACDAQHIAGELVNRFLVNSRPYAALALTTDAAVLTSCGNDYGFDQVYERQVQALGRVGDVLIAISTSGNSENVLRACTTARQIGMKSLGLLGGDGGKISSLVDLPLTISCTREVPRIQEGHLLILHALCEYIEETLEKE